MVTPTFLSWIAWVLRVAAIGATIFVVAGLIGFLTDEVRDSSKVSATRITLLDNGGQPTKTVDITQPDPPADVERAREREHSGGREFIDDVGDVLMSPFTWVGDGSKAWVQRLIDSGLAL